MISYSSALDIIEKAAHPLTTEIVPLLKAYGRVASEDIVSPMMSPPFDNSAMDGFALHAAETALASTQNPLYFSVAEVVAAGQHSTYFGEKTAIKIMTGAPLPAGYNAVLTVEEAVFVEGKLCITTPFSSGKNIRYAGEDIQHHDVLLKAGDCITSNALMALATVGASHISVKKQPKISIITTGDEIVHDYEKKLSESEIYNSNYPYLMGVFQKLGLSVNYVAHFPDDLESYKTIIRQLLQSHDAPDIIISTGAVSKGDYDYIPTALHELGADILFHRVNIRPGKPILFATFDDRYYFGLPGNPIASAVGHEFFIKPLMYALQGLPKPFPIFAVLKNSFLKKGNFKQFLKARAYINKSACLCVEILTGQESFKVKPLLQANVWVIALEESIEMKAGSLVEIVLMENFTKEVIGRE